MIVTNALNKETLHIILEDLIKKGIFYILLCAAVGNTVQQHDIKFCTKAKNSVQPF